ncbi:MAG: hypothetical protein FJY29_02060 [Betaproteobacteria bacterium]|nr:hypothetical protein [Betaproteobacteria bacterium]
MQHLTNSPLQSGIIAFSALALTSHHASADSLSQIKLKPNETAQRVMFKAFTRQDVLTDAPMSTTGVELHDGRVVPLSEYLNALNKTERELNAFGATLRTNADDLGTVAVSAAARPTFTNSMPVQSDSPENTRWSHEVTHDLAHVRSSGNITQREIPSGPDRTTMHSVSGRLLDAQAPSLASVVQRVVRLEDGSEQRETQIYVNGKQVFRRGRIDDQEARIWNTAFDVPLKNITIPVGPGSIDAKVGIRGTVNLDLELAPTPSNSAAPQFSLNFKPQILADGYLSAASSPTSVGDAGIEGAITLAKNTLDVKGAAALARGFKIEVKEVTVDNLFEGFNGRIFGYANVTIPGKKDSTPNKKKFEKEFYSWNGVKVEQRLYEYKSPAPQPL